MSLKNEKLIGNLVKDPVTKTVGEYGITEISVAVNLRFKDTELPTRYFKVAFFGKLGQSVARNFIKGERIAIFGGYTDIEFWRDEQGNNKHAEILKNPETYLKVAKLAKLEEAENQA